MIAALIAIISLAANKAILILPIQIAVAAIVYIIIIKLFYKDLYNKSVIYIKEKLLTLNRSKRWMYFSWVHGILPKNPNFGVFVKEHARSVKQAGNQIVVIALVLRKNKKIFHFKKTDFRDENGVRTITLEIESVFKNFFLLSHIIPIHFYKKIYKTTY